MEPAVEGLKYEREEWDDVTSSESSGSDTGSVVLEGNRRQRDEIKVFLEPAAQNVLQ
jgi:hypothetical protein